MLVSIVVVTYNSAEFLVECLESIRAQSYRELELIVTDDSSKDNTVDIAKQWIENNRSRFVSAFLLETLYNTGVAGNCNRGLNAVNGKWAKFIAGDDLLADRNTIETYVNRIPKRLNIGSIFSDIYQLKDGTKKRVLCKNRDIFFHGGVTANEQNKILIKENFIPAPSAFFYVSAIKNVGGYDETIPMCEDGVLWINLTKNGYLLYYINKPLVVYRVHGSSLVGQFHSKINVRLLNDQIKILDRYKIPGHRGLWKIHFKWLKSLLLEICKLSTKHVKFSQFLMFIYRLCLHSVNRVYFVFLKLRKCIVK